MPSRNIFIHIPKTGGTTINCVMNKTDWQTKPDFNYRHILYESKRSNSKDIFNPMNYDKYADYDIFMLLRDPIDRLISEYYFIRDRHEFLSLIKPIPKSLKAYVSNRQTSNYMIGFLLGKRMFDTDLVDRDDLELVINSIERLNIHVGIFEDYARSLNYFGAVTGIKWPKTIDIKRMTLNRPAKAEVPEDIKSIIREKNVLDFELYDYCRKRFESIDLKKIRPISFDGDKYNYVMKYTQRFNLLELALRDKSFIAKQNRFFNDLNLHLHKTLKLREGRDYVTLWNAFFISAMNNAFPKKSITKRISSLDASMEPLTLTKAICEEMNKSVKEVKSMSTALQFNPSAIDSSAMLKQSSGSFIGRIKSKLFK
ncbi:MAG: sulfotransferase family 2 domain-containing protein [Flavobacteriaceae bacterium]|nr:sulfotransferase family 2 domain-containing protein [Flavobacteriaceae bacterium]